MDTPLRLFPSIIALLMVAGTLPAQTTDSPSTTKKDREPVGINLSLWKNMSTQQTDTVGSTCLNLGLFSSMNRLNGVGINLLGGVVLRDMNGVQITGLANLVGGSMRGVQIAGISNVNVIRLLPPLCLTMAEADEFIGRFRKVLV